MYSDVLEVKQQLQELCNDYIDILQKLKNENIINKETYDLHSSNKIYFLDKECININIE